MNFSPTSDLIPALTGHLQYDSELWYFMHESNSIVIQSQIENSQAGPNKQGVRSSSFKLLASDKRFPVQVST